MNDCLLGRHQRVLERELRDRLEWGFGCDLRGLQLCTGPEAARFLRPRAAIAAAVDADTILLGPGFGALPEATRALVIAHEVAHTLQLARPGNDPRGLLESEAWACGRQALAGRRVRVRGRAGEPLCAIAVVASNMQPAIPYYGEVPSEPIDHGEVPVTACQMVDPLAIPLLEALAHIDIGGDAVIVCHASEQGIAIRLDRGNPAGLNLENVGRMLGVLDYGASQPQFAIDAHHLDSAHASELFGGVQAVRSRHLNGVHFRGCNLGVWESITLPTFRRLLGCQLVTGLGLKSAYAQVPPPIVVEGSTPAARRHSFDAHMHRDAFAANVDGGAEQRFGYEVRINDAAHTIRFSNVYVESDAATGAWLRRHLPQRAQPYTTGGFYIHGLLNVGSLIFPYANGAINQEYRRFIRANRASDDI